MQCFICVTCMIILCGASPSGTRDIATTHEKRSLFRDVIESLRIRAQLPEDFNQNDNNLAQSYDGYSYDIEPSHLPSDADFIPRRNDRIEMPSMKYRFPKSIELNDSNVTAKPQREIVLYIDDRTQTTQKPKKEKRTKPYENKVSNKNKENEDDAGTEAQTDDNAPFTNNMAGQSQIGNRESQTVIKPTVIVNIRGSVNHKDGEIRLNRRQDNSTRFFSPLNVFNINQDVRFQKDGGVRKGFKSAVKHEVKLNGRTDPKVDDMVVFETATWQTDNNQDDDKPSTVLQILLSI